MALFRVAVPRQAPTPVRIPTWNGTIRAGDDLKLALTLLNDDGETPAQVEGSNSCLVLCPDERRAWSHDYGLGWATWAAGATKRIAGYTVPDQPGRLNFQLPADATGDLFGRYRLFVEVDLYDGGYTELEGILQVRPGKNELGNAARVYFQPGITPIGVGIIPGNEINGVPTDADGFYVAQEAYALSPSGDGTSSILGFGILGEIVLGSAGTGQGFVLGQSVLGQENLG